MDALRVIYAEPIPLEDVRWPCPALPAEQPDVSFLTRVAQARAALQNHGRVSIRGLGRELGVEADDLEEIVEELVDIQQVAKREGKALVWLVSKPPAATKQDVSGYTPKHLADKILASRSAMEGEKKQVTVLFCDVAGSMDLADALGPEAWHQTLNQFFEVLTSSVHEFEGTVNQYTGDGIMALFGAPIAAEDHARRACMAALAIQERLSTLRSKVETEHGEQFAARIGINSGEVVVGRIGDDLRMDYTAQGQVVGIAARLEALASANGILLSAYTASHISDYFDLASEGEKTIKGLKQALEVFQLGSSQTETTRFDVSRRQGLTKFIGREANMATLQAALAEAQAGNGQVVGVVAEAGTGKSRLCYEFLETCKARGMTVLQGHAVSHGKNIPFLPMMQVFKAYYGITEVDDDRTAREKIAGRLVLLDEKFKDLLPLQFEFFGIAEPDAPPVPMAPEAKQRQLINVLRQIVHGSDPNIGNIIAYIEDLHWLDDGSEVFLEEWVDALAGSSSLLLVNFRPEYRAQWMQKPWYRQMPLTPLSAGEVQQMLIALLGTEPSVSGLAELIFERTGGNPFFCEEVVKSLQESGGLQGTSGQYVLTNIAAEVEIPQSVQAVLAARIDRLFDDEKSLLQTAAVIGRTFNRVLLAEVSKLPAAELDRSLGALKAGEFIFQRSHGFSEEYIFKHALTQEVALGSQLSDKLKASHARVAQAVENLNQDKLDENAALIAHHWQQAGEALTAAQWYMRAADHLVGSDIVQAMRQMQAALKLTDSLAESEARNRLRLEALGAVLNRGSWRINIGRQTLESHYQEALHLLAGSETPHLTARIKVGYAVSMGLCYGDIEAHGRLIDECLEEFEKLVSRKDYASQAGAQGYSLYCRGLLQRAQQAFLDVRHAVGDDFSIGQQTFGLSALGQNLAVAPLPRGFAGDLQAAITDLFSAYEQLKNLGHFELSLWAAAALAILNNAAGNRPPPHSPLESLMAEATRLADERASDFTRVYLLSPANRLTLKQENAHEVVKQCQDLLTESRERYACRESEAQHLSYLSEAQLLAGRVGDAIDSARDAVALAHQKTALLFELLALIALLRALFVQGDAEDECKQALERAAALLEETGARALEPQLVELQGRLAAATGDEKAAHANFEIAHRLYVEVGADGHAQRLAEELKLSS